MAINGINGITQYYPVRDNNVETERNYYYNTHDENEQDEPKLGSAKTEVAKKGFKYIWKSLKNFVSKVLHGDEEAHKKIVDAYDTADKINKILEFLNKDNEDDNRHNEWRAYTCKA